MASKEVRIELLLGKRVVSREGKPVGRIEEVRAIKRNGTWQVEEYLIGAVALLERLSAWRVGMAILTVLGMRKLERGYKIPWDKLDLSDPQKPRLLCAREDLEPMTEK